MTAQFVQSVPVWVLGPKAGKFQPEYVQRGIAYVVDRLLAIQKLSDEYVARGGLPILTSMHVLHEMKTRHPKYEQFNSPFAITFEGYMVGVQTGKYPRGLALTAPAFGSAGLEFGAILSPYPSMVTMARTLHIEAIERAAELKAAGLGEGFVIIWPSFDSRVLRCTGGKYLDEGEAWKRLVDFWVDVLGTTGGVVHLEWKPSDPGVLDYICTLDLAIKFCKEVNRQLGRVAMFINNEWAHLLIGGRTVAWGTAKTIKAGLFRSLVHVNSAHLHPATIEAQLRRTGDVEAVSTGIDWDWWVGAGGVARWNDQQSAVEMLKAWQGTVFAEHDLNPLGEEPIAFASVSISNFDRMVGGERK